jgi:hypothetical protein
MAYLASRRLWGVLILTVFVLPACTGDALSSPRCSVSESCEGNGDPDDGPDGNPPVSEGEPDAGGNAMGDPTLNGAGIPCEVQSVLRKHCTLCHSSPPSFNAPMPLTSQADFVASRDGSRKVYELVQERIHASDASERMPPASQEGLSGSELSALDAWLADGAQTSEESCGGAQGDEDAGAPPIDTTELECHKLLAHAPDSKSTPYAVGMARDAYVNFSFTAPWQGTAYGIVIRPVIDNAQVLHHWLLFQSNTAVADGTVAGSNGTHPDGELVHGWAPGGQHVDFREHGDVGFEFPGGTTFTVEMHYNSSDGAALDASGVELCVQKQKPANLAGVSWLGTDAIFFTTSAQSTCVPTASEPIHIVGVSPHMHLKGKHMKGIVNRANGSSETLHDGAFSFNDQTFYPKDLTLMPGDTITTTCEWSSLATFGKKTSDEMCYMFTLAYPKGALADGKVQGTSLHGSGACLGL